MSLQETGKMQVHARLAHFSIKVAAHTASPPEIPLRWSPQPEVFLHTWKYLLIMHSYFAIT